MKLKKITTACALACAAVAGNNAYALGAFDTPDVTMYLAGASAPQNYLGNLATLLFAGVKGTDWFTYGSNDAGPGTDFRAYFGVIQAGTDIPAALVGKKVLLVNRAKGGSVWGVNPVARAQGIQYMPITLANCGFAPAGGFEKICGELGSDPGFGAPTGDEQIPDFGVSDVEPVMFKDPFNVESGQSQLTAAELAVINASIKTTGAVMFGAAVTQNVVTPLGGTGAAPIGTGSSDASISAADYGAMLTGKITNWNAVGRIGSTAVAGPVGSAAVNICRRVHGSGTQASYNAFFANFPCSTNALAENANIVPLGMEDSAGFDPEGQSLQNGGPGGTPANPVVIDASQGLTIVENFGSGDVRNCLVAAQNGVNYTFTGGDNQTYIVTWGGYTSPATNVYPATGSAKAIGTLSLDSLGSTSGGTKWSFIRLNGVDASKANQREGVFPFVFEQTMQYRVSGTHALTDAATTKSPAGLEKTFADTFIKRASDPAVLNTIGGGSGAKWNSVMATPAAGYTPDGVNDVSKVSRFGKSCAPLQKKF